MTPEEKRAFANEAEKAVFHELVQECMAEYADNMSFKLEGLPRYGLIKVAHYAASVARAQALGIDIDELRVTRSEHAAHALKLAKVATDAGVPVTIIVHPDDEESDQ